MFSRGLFSIDIRSGEANDPLVLLVPGTVAWRIDGSGVLFSHVAGVSYVSAEGGMELPIQLPVKSRVFGLTPHPDGTRLAYTVWSVRTEFWVMENLFAATSW